MVDHISLSARYKQGYEQGEELCFRSCYFPSSCPSPYSYSWIQVCLPGSRLIRYPNSGTFFYLVKKPGVSTLKQEFLTDLARYPEMRMKLA